MKRIPGLFLIVTLLVALLPAGVASAQSQVVTCQTVAASLGATYDEGLLAGSKYCILYPPKKDWNRDLVLFAHGYVFVDPTNPFKQPDIPWDQAIRGDLNLPGILIKLGYAFAITSYHKDGLAVKEGVQDVVTLVDQIRKTNRKVSDIYLTGVSEGGLVTTQAIEKYPQLFKGGFATCGPIGNFQGQVKYWEDFRALFDVIFPTALRYPVYYPPSTPIYIDPNVTLGWAGPVGSIVGNLIQNNPGGAFQLVTAAQAPYDPNNLSTIQDTIAGLLTYNVMATNEGRRELANNLLLPDDTLKNSTTGSPYTNGGMVNGIPVEPFTADPAALVEINQNYQTSGSLSRQLVVMHTTGDPIVPFWHTSLYTQKVIQEGSLGDYTLIPINRYGHCNFTPAEAVLGFYIMVIRSSLTPFTAAQIQRALPDKQGQMEFSNLKNQYSDKMK